VYAVAVLLAGGAVALIGVAPQTATVVVVSVFGIALGGGFAMGLALLSEWAHDGPGSARLTAMAFSVTYLTASFGPLVAGALLDAYDSWPLVYALLALVCVAQLATIPAMRRDVRIA
jgi:cyanate permease